MHSLLVAILFMYLSVCKMSLQTNPKISTDPKYIKEIDHAIITSRFSGGPYLERVRFDYDADNYLYRLNDDNTVDRDLAEFILSARVSFNNNFSYVSHCGGTRVRFDFIIDPPLLRNNYTISMRFKNTISSNSYIEVLIHHIYDHEMVLLTIRKHSNEHRDLVGRVRELSVPLQWSWKNVPHFLWAWWTRPQNNFSDVLVVGSGYSLPLSGKEEFSPLAVFPNLDHLDINALGILLRQPFGAPYRFNFTLHVEWLNLTEETYPEELNDMFEGVAFWPAFKKDMHKPHV